MAELPKEELFFKSGHVPQGYDLKAEALTPRTTAMLDAEKALSLVLG